MGDDIAEAIQALKTSVDVLKANPELLHTPELSFFKEYLQSFGAKIPPPPNEQKPVRFALL
jgi:suppressor of tumorigenicity protein 13